MGVKDLMTWIKRVHPGAVAEFPGRWAEPSIRGRRVAVDGTLITNRFHFALRQRMDLRGKHALRGWYGLITEMKAHGVHPVAIWDEKGERQWKAHEARRRLQVRATALARKLHEDRRAVRLARLRRELVRFGRLSDAEQEVVRLWWRECRRGWGAPGDGEGRDGVVDDGNAGRGSRQTQKTELRGSEGTNGPRAATISTSSPSSLPSPPCSPSRIPTATPTPASPALDPAAMMHPIFLQTVYTLSRLSPHLHRLSWLLDSYTADADPEARCGSLQQTLFEAFQAEEEAVFRIVASESGAAGGMEEQEALWADPSEEVNTLLEARLRALEPASVYNETPRQRALTVGEGEVWALAFGVGEPESEGMEVRVGQDEPQAGASEPVSEAGVETDASRPDPQPSKSGDDSQLSEASQSQVHQEVAVDTVSSPVTPPPAEPVDAAPQFGLAAALAQLDDLRSAAPGVRNTYMSNLLIPLESEHAACRELLERMGVPVLFAPVPYEAEGFASAMALRGQVDFVGTEDSDVVVYGAPLLRNLSMPGSPLVLIDSMALRGLAGLTESAFRDFCILLGTDASPRIPGIGPTAATQWINKYGSIEAVLEAEPSVRARIKKLPPPEDVDNDSESVGVDPDSPSASPPASSPATASSSAPSPSSSSSSSPSSDPPTSPDPSPSEEVTQEELAHFLDMVHNSRRLFDLLPPTPEVTFEGYTPARDQQVRAWLAEQGVYVKAPGERRRERERNEAEEFDEELAAELGFESTEAPEPDLGAIEGLDDDRWDADADADVDTVWYADDGGPDMSWGGARRT